MGDIQHANAKTTPRIRKEIENNRDRLFFHITISFLKTIVQ